MRSLLTGKQVPALVLALMIWMVPLSANAWWDQNWEFRKKISLSASAAGIGESQTDVSVLLRLHTANLDFASLKENGADLRFLDADDKTPLKYHVEMFDPVDEMALVWVKVPRLTAGSVQDTVWMYWGNDKAVDGQDKNASFDVNQSLTLHFDESEGAPRDATAYANHPGNFTGRSAEQGVIGKGIGFGGAGDMLVIPSSPSLDISAGFTFSAWVKLAYPQSDAYLLAVEDNDRALIIGIEQTRPYAVLRVKDRTFKAPLAGDLTPETWHHLAVTMAPNDRITLYLDGREAGSNTLPIDLPTLSNDWAIGASLRGGHSLAADLDELNISRTARSGDWILTGYQSQSVDNQLVAFNEIEAGEGGGVNTLLIGTIAANITLDGWIIIGILFLLGVVSGILFVNKAYNYRQMLLQNREFLLVFIGSGDMEKVEGQKENFGNSPLYKIFESGVADLRSWSDKHVHLENPRMSPKAFNMFKSVLENGYMEQNRQINAGLIILTMSISGAPFLGLLGTVWGVMNTFAAMAMAGEANIMAIAPGVASALATTVFGLIVAIPALFGYNYLAGKVKLLAADLGMFVDRFSNLVDQEFVE